MDYYKMVPHDTFMGRYLQYMASQETAHEFDWWTGLWCISGAVARSTWVARPRAPVYLNAFVILVGESGTARKTTAVSVASRLVRHTNESMPDVGFLDAKVTPEKLDNILHDRTMEYGNAQLCIAVPELAVFLGTERYIAHMPTLLTDLYDCPGARDGGGTISRGVVTQRGVWVTFLSASTPIWLLKTVNPNVIEGGFTSRCYFIISNEPKRSIPWPEDADTELYSDLCTDLKTIAAEARTHGPIQLHDDARAYFTNWYQSRTRSVDPFKQSFEAREDAHVLRVAALLAINDGGWVVCIRHLVNAIKVLGEVKENSSAIFESAEAQSKFAMGLDILRAQLVSAGMDPIPRHRLYLKVRTHLDNAEFQALLEVLHEIGAIQRFHMKQDGRGRPTDYIRGTQMLLARGLGATVMDRFS